jgi:hypothetical protein
MVHKIIIVQSLLYSANMGQTNTKPQAVIKSAAAARGDDDTTVVGVYDIKYCPALQLHEQGVLS